MKSPLHLILGLLLIVFQIGLFWCPDPTAHTLLLLGSLLLGLVIAAYAFCPAAARPKLPPSESECPAAAAPAAPAPPPVRPEAELVAFLALLQEKGRLVDFIQEDLTSATDAQVGAAARVVHAGCRKVLTEYFSIQPVRSEAEGVQVELLAGYDTTAHRLLGQVAPEPPYRGKLLHPGWRASEVRLPTVTGITPGRPWPVLAPAEVEIRA